MLKKLFTVIKHIPGHGCSTKDSHLRFYQKLNLSEKKFLNQN